MKLLIDVGNSRIKWALLHGTELAALQTGVLSVDPILPAGLFDSVGTEAVIASNVAGSRVAQAIRDEARLRWGVNARFVVATEQAFGVHNAYATPAQLGADRWAAMIGAFVELGGPVCVVDAGTAFTVDVIARDGRHLGGLIVPGIELMVTSLRARTSDIAAVARTQSRGSRGMLADNTADALRKGALHALAGLVERAVTDTERHDGPAMRIVLTGGDAELIQAALRRASTYNPALVLRGLAEFAKE